MVSLVPGGPNGTLLNSCCPSRTRNSNNCGCTLEVRSMFNVSCESRCLTRSEERRVDITMG